MVQMIAKQIYKYSTNKSWKKKKNNFNFAAITEIDVKTFHTIHMTASETETLIYTVFQRFKINNYSLIRIKYLSYL